jgi:hypothetical protein
MPGFNDPGFGDRLSDEIAALKGRELPGFLNLQVFYGFMIQNVETWKPAVESCRYVYINTTLLVYYGTDVASFMCLVAYIILT